MIAAALLSGCAPQTFQVADGNQSKVAAQERMQTFFVSGIGQTKEINAAKPCGGADSVV